MPLKDRTMQQNGVLPEKPLLFRRILYSVFPGMLRSGKVREGYRRFFNSLILHFRPRTVPERTLRLTLTWGLGGMAVVLVFMLMGTGVLLKFAYEPFPGTAYESIIHLQRDVPFGGLIRNVHYWSANLLLVVAFLHFLRVFFTGAFHSPRQFNWIIGLGLLLTVLFSNFTGYLMPWDQLAYWAITISTGMLEYVPVAGPWLQRFVQGGSEMGPATLANFYAIHTAILPALLIILMPFHFWRIRKAGGLVIPRLPEEDPDTRGGSVDAIPNLILREAVVALVLVAFMLVISVFFDAPLGSEANPGLSPNPTKAPWYFAGIQEMLLHFHPLFSLFVIPVLTTIAALSVPYLDYPSNTGGVWFASSKGRRMALVSVAIAAIATPLGVLIDEYIIESTSWLPGLPSYVSTGLVPFGIVLGGIAGFYVMMKRRYSATENEAVQAVFVLLVTTFILLTLTGIWFRGPGMKLVWP
jgi:quinol-cytochrome oxidoreductase complex cytochrome b subunit